MTDQTNTPEQNNATQNNAEAQNHDEQGHTEKTMPSHIAYQVRETEDKSYFNNIGAAYEHRDGQGYNIQLDSVPVDGKVTLRSFEERLNKVQNSKNSQSRDQEIER